MASPTGLDVSQCWPLNVDVCVDLSRRASFSTHTWLSLAAQVGAMSSAVGLLSVPRIRDVAGDRPPHPF
jgi:hypothetical protein